MSEKKAMRFKGHETFTLREGWINKGLTEVKKNPLVFGENFGADALGVGPNMAKAIRYWLKCAELTLEVPKEGTRLTDIGETILKEDPYIEDLFTLWLLHCKIAANYSQATAWNLFFNEFNYEEFHKGQLIQGMKELVDAELGQISSDKKIAEKSVEADCDAILHMYVKKNDKTETPEEKNVSPFGKLELIKILDGIYVRKQPDLSRLPEDIVLYLFVECLSDKKSVNIDDLLMIVNGPGKLLQLRRNALVEELERLEARDLITMNRTAGLNMIYVQNEMCGNDVIKEYYNRR